MTLSWYSLMKKNERFVWFLTQKIDFECQILSLFHGFQLEFVKKSHFINHMTCYNSSALIGWKFILKKSICKICSPTWLLDSTNESTRIYNRSCVWITSLYLQIPTENHSKRLKSSYLKLKIHYHIWKRESILIFFKTKIHLGLEFLHLLHCLH